MQEAEAEDVWQNPGLKQKHFKGLNKNMKLIKSKQSSYNAVFYIFTRIQNSESIMNEIMQTT